MRARLTGLWRNPDFLKLWAGETVSLFGSAIGFIALPLTALATLGATPAQLGILNAIRFAPFLLVAPFAGVWVDRLPRRPLLIGAALGQAALLAWIPLAAVLGRLRLEQVFLVAFLSGILRVLFDVAYLAFLPALVGREGLVEGNSKLEVSYATAQVAGPGLGGLLTGAIGAPLALGLDALSFLVSAFFIGRIRAPERPPAVAAARRAVLAEIGEGLHLVLAHPLLRALAGGLGTHYFFSTMLATAFVVWAARDLALAPATLGLLFGAGGAGTLLGALAVAPVTRRCGVGATIVGGQVATGLLALLTPLAGGGSLRAASLTVPLLLALQFAQGISVILYDINQLSLRQGLVPDRLQGRTNATFKFLTWGVRPFGALLGGTLGTAIGLPLTIALAAAGWTLAALWSCCSPLRRLRDAPAAPDLLGAGAGSCS